MSIKKRFKFYSAYTVVFAAVAGLCFSFFLRQEKSFLWGGDGLYQHYNAFLYLGKWCRELLATLLTEHRLVIPMWEWGIGYGGDVFTTLSYYVFGDPFALISVFFPAAYSELGYALSILLRFYVAGIAFCAYADKMGCERFPALCGSILYAFCAFSLFGMRHPYFITPMIYLPLIFLGVEKILAKETPVAYILSVAIAAISNFYFFYMLVILTILYAAIRVLLTKETRSLKIAFGYFLRFAGYALIGVAMAAVLFLPNVMAFEANTRISDAYAFDAFYHIGQYEAFPGAMISNQEGVPWGYTGMAPPAWLGAGALLTQRKKDTWAKVYLGILALFLLFPFAGHVFNGFGYVTNRWVFAWSLCVAFLFAKGYPFLFSMERKKKIQLCLGCTAYTLLCLLLKESRTQEVLAGCLLLFLCLFALWGLERIGSIRMRRVPISSKRALQAVTLALTLACTFEMAYFRYSPEKWDYTSSFQDKGTSYSLLTERWAAPWDWIDEDSNFYRIDHAVNEASQRNFLVSSGQSTTTTYWSLLNPHLIEFLQYNSAYEYSTFRFSGLSSRSLLLPLASAKYFVALTEEDGQKVTPYSFSLKKGANASGYYPLYQTEYTLPLGYTYDSTLSLEDYEALSFAKRQQATLQSAVIPSQSEGRAALLQGSEPVYSDISLDYQITCDSKTELDGKTLLVKKGGGTITLTFDCPKNVELYVQLLDLNFESKSEVDFWSEETWNEKSEEEKAAAWQAQKSQIPPTFTLIRGFCGDATAYARYFTPQHIYAEGREDFLINLFYSDQARSSLKLRFSGAGIYEFSDLSVIAQPMEGFEERIDALRADTLERVQLRQNHVSADISLDAPKLLCLSIPYSRGWSLSVNGEKAETIRTNIMYLGVMLEAGEHHLELNYQTPYLAAGAALSVLGCLGLGGVAILTNQKRKKKLSVRI